MGAETAESKRLSRTDSDSLLSVVSKDLERCLQNAIDIAAAYVNMEAPQVQLDRDFDTQVLDGNQVTQYTQLWTQGAITHETFLEMLKKGEVLPDVDVEREVELVNQEKLANADLFAAGGVLGDEEEQDAKEREDAQGDDKEDEGQSEIRAEVEKRLKRLGKSSDNKEEDKN
nr:Phage portal protein [uncultured Mediterranean phage uvMED]